MKTRNKQYDENGLFVLYTCPGCKVKDQPVHIRFRFANENVVHYFKATVTVAIAAHHNKHSPRCRAKVLHNIMIPLINDDGIGFKPLQS